MRIARIATAHGSELAVVDPANPGQCRPTGIGDALESLLDATGLARVRAAAADAPPQPISDDRLLAPLIPRTLIGVGLNYRAHAAEQGRALPAEPPLFLKNTRSIAAPFSEVPLHPGSTCLDYEAELGIVIGRSLFNASEAEAAAAIIGWVVIQDYTLRDLARPETLTIAKGGPAMAPIGPWLTTIDAMPVAAAQDMPIRCWVNGSLRQSSTTADMHFDAVALVRHICRFLPLGPGDIIASGSPGGSGVGFDPPIWLGAGDRVETEIGGLGRIAQRVV